MPYRESAWWTFVLRKQKAKFSPSLTTQDFTQTKISCAYATLFLTVQLSRIHAGVVRPRAALRINQRRRVPNLRSLFFFSQKETDYKLKLKTNKQSWQIESPGNGGGGTVRKRECSAVFYWMICGCVSNTSAAIRCHTVNKNQQQ